MITWIRHKDNYEMQPPQPHFPIAVWISGVRALADDRLIFSVSIYAGSKRVDGTYCIDFESAENYVIHWLERIKEGIENCCSRGNDR